MPDSHYRYSHSHCLPDANQMPVSFFFELLLTALIKLLTSTLGHVLFFLGLRGMADSKHYYSANVPRNLCVPRAQDACAQEPITKILQNNEKKVEQVVDLSFALIAVQFR